MTRKLPREIVITEQTKWIVAGDPRTCLSCGHLHYPRTPEPNPRNRAPQWGFCERADCGCNSLHTTNSR